MSTTKKFEKEIRENEKKYELLAVKKSRINFTTKKFKLLSTELTNLKIQYNEKSTNLLKEFRRIFASYLPILEELSEVLLNLDILLSFSDVALNSSIPYVKPVMKRSEFGLIDLKKSRHPCVELQSEFNSFQDNDIHLENSNSSFIVFFFIFLIFFKIITGPNMFFFIFK
jgi:DNA mismatch repair ATPase MutS